MPAIVALLEAAHLPARELEQHLDNVVVAEQDGRVVACGGLEAYADGTSGLVRSMAVDESLQGSGVGSRIMEWVLDRAKALGITQLLLFTMDAHDFYLRFGFTDATLDDFPEGARQSFQYRVISTEGRDWGVVAMQKTLQSERPL
jgi:amino-acid N-acetyltransferase